ncbi:MAG TPA: hypothetical protein VN282_05955 [Pyrinomonadaceae bacterium]|nr:hypothetical protein [Pyrinomonadaceae bacterium]
MKKLPLLLTLLLATPLATAGQVCGGAPPRAPAGLTLEKPDWAPIHAIFFGSGGGGGASGPAIHPTPTSRGPSVYPQPGNYLRYSSRGAGGGGSNTQGADLWRRATVRLTNDGPRTVKRVWMEFVFQDPSTGEESLRVRHASRKRLSPGKTFIHIKTVKTTQQTRRGDGARMCVELREVTYSDGTVWRPS